MVLSSATLGCVVFLQKLRTFDKLKTRLPNYMSPEFGGDAQVCVFDAIGSSCVIMTMLSFGIKCLSSTLPIHISQLYRYVFTVA
ncbi:hypothetical protein P692DRAFT_20358802 [Suillus brevipes Sb2]|nr:hypothetical protein P692DRAFT_20358802 [Suillus brevipes Sb2]